MKSHNTKINRTLVAIGVGLAAGVLAFNANANSDSNAGADPQLIYQSHTINHNIYSYLSKKAGELSLNPEIIYVSQANGPAIYSYQHTGTEQTVTWNIEYVNTAYNPAIYSYESPQLTGEVNMLPIKFVE